MEDTRGPSHRRKLTGKSDGHRGAICAKTASKSGEAAKSKAQGSIRGGKEPKVEVEGGKLNRARNTEIKRINCVRN